MLWALVLAALLVAAALRVFVGYPRAGPRFRHLSRQEIALLTAAGDAVFPRGGAIPASAADADVAGYVDRWLAALRPRQRLQMHLLFFLVEHATLVFPAPGVRGFRRLSSLAPEQRIAALEGWRTSPRFARRLVFASLRAILTMAWFAHPPVLRQLGLAPREIASPVREADLLYPPIGRTAAAIRFTPADLSPPGATPPLDQGAPLHPRFAERRS